MPCLEQNCKIKRPVFNLPGQKKGIYCQSHKRNEMVNVLDKKCMHPDCDKRPNYNLHNEKTPLYCVTHKQDGMIDISHKRCIQSDCDKISSYNNPGEKIALYCASHKLDGMIDIKNKRCIQPDCDKRPVYNKAGEKTALYCATHAKNGMIDIKHKTCILCPTRPSNKHYKGYCYRCFIYTFPDSPILRNHKTKERHVADFIKKEFPQYNFTFDKIIQDGCSRRRPDILLDMAEYVIIIEIDENQHQKYDSSCENKRLMEIFQDCGSRPLVMIRFNPDQYYYFNNKSVASCWTTTNDRGLCIIKTTKKKEWESRLQKLKEMIQLQIDFTEERKDIDIIHLFYDESC